MANHKSAIKRHRQSLVRRDRNKATRGHVRETAKEVRLAIEGGDPAAAKKALIVAEKAMAKAANKGLYHKKTLARKIGRLATQVAKASQSKK